MQHVSSVFDAGWHPRPAKPSPRTSPGKSTKSKPPSDGSSGVGIGSRAIAGKASGPLRARWTPCSTRHEERRVQPYHLGCIENQWYLFGFDLVRQQLRTFALPRMRKVRDTRTGFHRPADFSISKHLSDSFGVFKGKAHHRVRLRFDSFAARLVGFASSSSLPLVATLRFASTSSKITLGAASPGRFPILIIRV